MIVCRKR